jgi:hypothetical protein
MKPLKSLSKKSQFINAPLRLYEKYVPFLPIFLIIGGCAIDADKSQTSQALSVAQQIEKAIEDETRLIGVFKPYQLTQSTLITQISGNYCRSTTESKAIELVLNLQTALGPIPITASMFFTSPEDAGWKITVDQVSFKVDRPSPFTEEDLTKLCESKSHGLSSHLIATTDTLPDRLQTFLSEVAPDCLISLNQGEGWQCELKSQTLAESVNTLDRIKTNMIQKWTRQPYILMRRMAVTHQFAQALNQRDPHASLDRICKVMALSTGAELPLAFANQRWRKQVCYQLNGEKRVTLANAALSKSVQELELLHGLVENSSRSGLLQVKIPMAQVPSKDLWITLTPSTTTFDTIKETIDATLVERRANKDKKNTSCWHPLFGGDDKSTIVAKQLILTGFSEHKDCTLTGGGDEKLEQSMSFNYLNDSISGETEFMVTNGQSKMLRLPLGLYTYNIRDIPPTLDTWMTEPAKIESTGEVAWLGRRPVPAIREWGEPQ